MLTWKSFGRVRGAKYFDIPITFKDLKLRNTEF